MMDMTGGGEFMRTIRGFGLALSPLALMLLAKFPAAAQQVEIIPEENHGLSAPLSSLPYEPREGATVLVHPDGPLGSSAGPVQEDPALQEFTGPLVGTTPGLNVLGLGMGFTGPGGTFVVNLEPPDTNAAVGATQVVETVNVTLAVFDKTTGAVVAGPTSLPGLFTTVSSICSNPNGAQSDPVVQYDQLAGRWVIEFVAGAAGTFGPPNKFCMAVSTTNNAAGTYHAYVFADSTGLNDYSKLGVWPDAYYLSTRQFNASQTLYLGPKACAADRSKMLTGAAATIQCFQVNNTSADGMLPSSLDGATPPPAGSPNYFLLIPTSPTGSSLQLFKFHVDFTTPANSRFTGPTNIAVHAYTEACAFVGCVPQGGTTNTLDGLGFTLMYRLAYRNFPSATPPHESLVVTHSIYTRSAAGTRLAPRWYEIRSPGTTPVVFQQGTFSPDATWRWAGSIAMDKVGDIALGYSASSATVKPAIRYTGRVPSDPAGTMESEANILAGTGSQTRPGNSQPWRWGDYSSMAIDPSDGCTFWYSSEYLSANGSFNWKTHLSSFKFTSCH
jgi:hypothetical protein